MPLLARIYPNGSADVNHFHAAGGVGFLIHTLLRAGLMHDDVLTISGRGLSRTLGEPMLRGDNLTWEEGPKASHDLDVLRPADEPVAADGGLKVLRGPLGTGVIKVSAVAPEHRVVTAPALIFDDQAEFLEAFADGRLDGVDFVAVIRYQGPAANGMPELHKLTPALGVLQDRGQRVAIVTDGRMSGASGKVPAAIHVTPEAALGGPLSRVRRRRRDHRRLRARPAATSTTRSRCSTAHRPVARPRARSGRAPAASCSRRSGPPSDPPTRAPASSRRTPPRRGGAKEVHSCPGRLTSLHCWTSSR